MSLHVIIIRNNVRNLNATTKDQHWLNELNFLHFSISSFQIIHRFKTVFQYLPTKL